TADISLSSQGAIDVSGLQSAINEEIRRCRTVVSGDPEALRVGKRDSKTFPVPAAAIATQEAFSAWQSTFTQPVIPDWAITVTGVTWQGEAEANQSKVACIEVINDSGPIDDAFVDSFIFETALSIRLANCQILPFHVDLAPKGFRFDPFIPGRGHNC